MEQKLQPLYQEIWQRKRFLELQEEQSEVKYLCSHPWQPEAISAYFSNTWAVSAQLICSMRFRYKTLISTPERHLPVQLHYMKHHTHSLFDRCPPKWQQVFPPKSGNERLPTLHLRARQLPGRTSNSSVPNIRGTMQRMNDVNIIRTILKRCTILPSHQAFLTMVENCWPLSTPGIFDC